MARFTQIGSSGSNGTPGVGIAKIEKTGTEGLVDTYTITYTNGTISTYTVTNGTGISSITSEESYESEGRTITPIRFSKNDGSNPIVLNITAKNGVGGGSGGGSVGTNNANLTVNNTTGWLSTSIAEKADCDISFRWSSIEDGLSTGPGIVTVKIGDVTKTSYQIEQGDVTVPIGQYLTTGTNRIKIEVSDIYDNMRNINFTVEVVAVSISSYFDHTIAYKGDIQFNYTPVGAIDKTVHFILDGEEIDTRIISVTGREQTFTIPAQTHGSHSFEVYFLGDVNGQTVESNHLYYDLICYEEGVTTPIISVPFNTKSVKQYSTVAIPYIVYTPNILSSSIKLKDGDKTVQTLTVDRTEQIWSYIAVNDGTANLSIVCGDVKKNITFNVTTNKMDVSSETENLELYLTSKGRSNNEENPLVWNYNDIHAELTGFNLDSDGWKLDNNKNTVLRVTGDARVNIPFNIFETDFRSTGKTIEFEFATKDVVNYDAVIISSFSDERGIKITAQKALLKSEKSEIFTQYKENETVRVAFTVDKRVENNSKPLIAIYINGIMSGVVQYPADDDFEQSVPVGISIGSNDCTTDIYCIRVYSNNLTRYQILDNWIADTQNVKTMVERYERNNVFDNYGGISVSKIPRYLPYMVLNVTDYYDLPQSKGNAKTISGKYVDILNPSRSFTFEGAEIDVQGTSSQYYPRKNYKIKFENGIVSNGETKATYRLRDNSIPTDEFTFKADVASSEGANNVELVRLYDDTCPVKTPPQKIDGRIRQGIEGYPCLMFYGEGENLTFIGKYNFNNDKATGEVFGLEDGDESWEILQNNTQMAVWKDDNFEGDAWTKTFDARYPKDNTDTSNLAEFATWLKSTDTMVEGLSDEEKTARLTKFKTEFANYANVDAMLFNYIFTEMFLMIDNRAKNAFPTRYDEDGKWLILPYDYDSAIGIDNEGALKFGYELEDTDFINGAQVYNGQESVLYNNIRLAFADELAEMYHDLRVGGTFSYGEIERRFEEHQKVWGEAIYNEDARFKYIDPLVNDGNGEYLKMLQGSKAEQRKWWLYNRFRYLDSKYNAGDAVEDFILLRTYGKSDLQITPYADIYASAKFDEILVQKRALRGQTYTLENPLDDSNHGVLSIFSASQLSSVGDLSGLKLSMGDFHRAIKLSSLKIGSNDADYKNENLTELIVGNLTLLRELDVRNCSNLTQSVDLSGCTNIERVYLDGTRVTSVSLPKGGILKTLHLPDTITSLTLFNQPSLTDLDIAGYSNISTLRIENMPNSIINTLDIINSIKDTSRVRLIGVDWNMSSATEVLSLMDKMDKFTGMDEYGNNVDNAVISGMIHIPSVSREQLDGMKNRYPNIRILYDVLTVRVAFYNDGTLFKEDYLVEGSRITKPANPTKTSTAEHYFTFTGWSLDGKNIVNIDSATVSATGNTYYAVYSEELRYYNVVFKNVDGTTLSSFSAGYGTIPVYNGDTPVDASEPESTFTGWTPQISEVTDHIIYTATYHIPERLAYRFYSNGYNSYYEVVGKGTVTTDVIIPDTFKGYPVTGISFSLAADPTVRSVYIGSNVKNIRDTSGTYPVLSYDGCIALESFEISENNTNSSLTSNIGANLSFANCSALKTVKLPNSVTTLKNRTFTGCTALESIDMPDGLTVLSQEIFNGCTSLRTANFGENSSLTTISSRAFNGCAALESIYIPYGVNTINSQAFHECESLKRVYVSDVTVLLNTRSSGSELFSAAGANLYLNDELVTELQIPDSINTLTYNTGVKGCASVTSLKVPDAVSRIDNSNNNSLFNDLPNLKTIYMLAGAPPTINNTGYSIVSPYSLVTDIFVPSNSGEAYRNTKGWDKVASYIRSTLSPAEVRFTYELINDGSAYSVIGRGNVTDTIIMIPSTYNDIPITSIGNGAFSSHTDITKVTIPHGVTSIGDNAFSSCTSLSSITVPTSVTRLGEYVFYHCDSLTSISLSDNITSIGEYAFAYCTSLGSINIPKGITQVSGHVFYHCSSLTSITLHEGITRVMWYAFEYCSSLETVRIPKSLTYFGSRAFAMTPLKYVYYSGKLEDWCSIEQFGNLGTNDFSGYYGSPIPTSINGQLYCNGTSLPSELLIPYSVTSIPSFAFRYANITSLIIPDNVTSIDHFAFGNCENLREAEIGRGVTYIGRNVFVGCKNMTSLVIKTTKPPYFEASGSYDINTVTTIYVPKESVEVYKAATNWSNYADRILPLP